MNNKTETLINRWETLKKTQPKIRIRDAASQLGVSEVELLTTQVGHGVTRLSGNWQNFLDELHKLGTVMSLTRNETCVLEHTGKFETIDHHGHASTIIGSIETRAFPGAWHVGFAVEQQQPKPMYSFQLFDEYGDAITKIYLKDHAHLDTFNAIIAQFKAQDQTPYQSVKQITAPTYNTQVDIEQLRHDWKNLKDTHDFYGLIRKYNIHRKHALELAGETYAYPIAISSLRPMLEYMATKHIPIMVFAGNRGNIQIHQDHIHKVVEMHQWLNIMDKTFTMHLYLPTLESAWLVKKPTTDGMVTSIEVFNTKDELSVQFFGLRKPGIPQRKDWQTYIENIPINIHNHPTP